MPAFQAKTFDAVHEAAVQISIEIDAMLAALPAGADQTEIASDLMDYVASMSDHPQFVAIFTDALIARRALTELGVKF